MKCAYCGKETTGTKEHIVSSGILDLFPECYLTIDQERNVMHFADPVVKDVCKECNNKRITYIDSYAKGLIGKYFTKKYTASDRVEIEYNYVMTQKMLLKYAYNDMRSHKMDCSFFDDEMIQYLLNESDDKPKQNVTVLCGLAVNVSPIPDAFYGNMKIRWCKEPFLYSDSVVERINYETGEVILNRNPQRETFPDLKLSYLFRFNSVQFLLMCWDKHSERIAENNILLNCQYPYSLLKLNEEKTVVPVCTDEMNYHHFEYVHVRGDGLLAVGFMRKLASGGRYEYKENFDKEWEKQEALDKTQHPRK